jgi:hypothetical protein
MNTNRVLLTSALFAMAFGLLLLPSVAADSNNNPGENNTNLPGDQPSDGGGGGNPGNNNPGENNTNLPGNQPPD